ncbi:MAG: F0F1 ATP synthase subunit B [Verrucomicrobiota bacterium]
MILHTLSTLPLANIIDNLEAVGNRTGFNGQQFFAQVIAFLVLCGALWKWAWSPVITVLEQRRKNIEESIHNAECIKKELADAEATRLTIIQKANDKANAIIAEAEKSAAAIAERRAQEATRRAEEIVREGHEAAVLDRNRLMAELKAQVGELVIQTTQKVTGKVLNAEDQRRLNDETVRQIEARNN